MFWIFLHNWGIRTHDLLHTSFTSDHYAASVNISVLLPSLTKIIYKNHCTARQLHLAAGVGHTWAGPAAPPAPSGSLGPADPDSEVLVLAAAPASLWHSGSSSFEPALTGKGAWLHPCWKTLAGCSWTVDWSKCNEHIRRGSLLTSHCHWNWSCHCGPGH